MTAIVIYRTDSRTGAGSRSAFVEPHAPEAGDIIVRREASNPRDRYSLREFPGVAQVCYVSFETALTIATRFARHAGTDVWHEECGRFTLVESRAAAGMA